MTKIVIAAILAMVLATDATSPHLSRNGLQATANDTTIPELDGRSADSLSALLLRQLASISSPALEARKAARLKVQKAGYANVLADALDGDGLGAFLSMTRMNAQVEFTISHRQLSIQVPIAPPKSSLTPPPYVFIYKSAPWEIPLLDDWSMPEDPWNR